MRVTHGTPSQVVTQAKAHVQPKGAAWQACKAGVVFGLDWVSSTKQGTGPTGRVCLSNQAGRLGAGGGKHARELCVNHTIHQLGSQISGMHKTIGRGGSDGTQSSAVCGGWDMVRGSHPHPYACVRACLVAV